MAVTAEAEKVPEGYNNLAPSLNAG